MNNNNDTNAIEGVVDVVAVVVETTNTMNDSFVSESSDELSDVFKWTWVTIIQSIVLFFLAGVAEIIGGWMVWYVEVIYYCSYCYVITTVFSIQTFAFLFVCLFVICAILSV